MFIDTHVHTYDPVFGRFAFPPAGSKYDRLITTKMLAEEAGSELASCIVVGCSNEYELNVCLLESIENDPLAGGYIGQVDLSDPDCVSYTKAYEGYKKYRGFRVNAHGTLTYTDRMSEMLKPDVIIELLGEWWHVLPWRDYISEHPTTQFVIEHFGLHRFNGEEVSKDYISFCRAMAELPNVAIKLSGMYTLCQMNPKPFEAEPFREGFRVAYEAFGADRCMFGSDWPICEVPYEETVRITRALLDSKEDAQKVLCGTARRIYGLGVYERLRSMDIKLVSVPPAAGAYATAVPFGENLMYFSGAGPLQHKGEFEYIGRVGEDLDEQQAYNAAHSVGITLLSNMHAVLGDLNRIKKIVKVTGFVNSAPGFCSQPRVINGFSELMLEVFGEKIGAHSRSAIGVAALPSNIPVEVEVLVEYR